MRYQIKMKGSTRVINFTGSKIKFHGVSESGFRGLKAKRQIDRLT